MPRQSLIEAVQAGIHVQAEDFGRICFPSGQNHGRTPNAALVLDAASVLAYKESVTQPVAF